MFGCEAEPEYAWEKKGSPPKIERAVSASASTEPPIIGDDAPSPHGGLWTRCREGLTAESDPARDVTRLVAVCGPSTGMESVGDGLIEGAVSEGSPVTLELRMKKDRCYRVFASVDRGVEQLDVEVRTSRGTLVASDHEEGRLAIAQPDRPFCTTLDDLAAITVRAEGGSGAFALEVLSVAAPSNR